MAKLILVLLLAAAIWQYLKPKQVKRSGRIAMEAAEARAVLGVGHDADEETIRAAHRRLLQAVHPDKGGTADLTRRINVARDTLLRRN